MSTLAWIIGAIVSVAVGGVVGFFVGLLRARMMSASE